MFWHHKKSKILRKQVCSTEIKEDMLVSIMKKIFSYNALLLSFFNNICTYKSTKRTFKVGIKILEVITIGWALGKTIVFGLLLIYDRLLE